MAKLHSYEFYNADGKEITDQEIYREAAEFWGVPYNGDADTIDPIAPAGGEHDLYMGVLLLIASKCREGLVDYHDIVGVMMGDMASGMKVNPRSYKMLIDKMAPYIKLVRHWQDKGYKIYSTRWDDEKEQDESRIQFLKKVWEEECPPSYAKYGDIQDFNPYLND